MKYWTKKHLKEDIKHMYGFLNECEQAELNYYNHSDDPFIKNNHYNQGITFKFIREYMRNTFRPLV